MRNLKQYWQETLTRINRGFAMPRARILRRRLSEVREENQALRLELQDVREILTADREQGAQLLAELRQQVGHLEEERDTTQQQLETLQGSLTVAVSRQERTEQRLATLDDELEVERREHRATLEEANHRTRRMARRTNGALLVAAVALLLAVATALFGIRDVRENTRLLAEVSRDLKDIKSSMRQHLAGNDHEVTPGEAGAVQQPPPGTARAVPAQANVAPALATGPPPVAPAFDHASYLDRQQYDRKRSRAEMLAFFRNNAGQEGIISMPSGLQYRVLRRGSGSSPGARDTVVVDYQAFLTDGTEIYSTYDAEQPAVFSIEYAAPGLREVLPKMEVGSQWELYVPPALAYRQDTRRQDRYGNKPLIYVVELLSVVAAGTAAID